MARIADRARINFLDVLQENHNNTHNFELLEDNGSDANALDIQTCFQRMARIS